MVVIQTGDGSIQDYRLCRTREGLRLIRPCASYDLTSMMREEGWRILGVRAEGTKRLLTTAGLLPAGVPLLPRSGRWHTSLTTRRILASHVVAM